MNWKSIAEPIGAGAAIGLSIGIAKEMGISLWWLALVGVVVMLLIGCHLEQEEKKREKKEEAREAYEKNLLETNPEAWKLLKAQERGQ